MPPLQDATLLRRTPDASWSLFQEKDSRGVLVRGVVLLCTSARRPRNGHFRSLCCPSQHLKTREGDTNVSFLRFLFCKFCWFFIAFLGKFLIFFSGKIFDLWNFNIFAQFSPETKPFLSILFGRRCIFLTNTNCAVLESESPKSDQNTVGATDHGGQIFLAKDRHFFAIFFAKILP